MEYVLLIQVFTKGRPYKSTLSDKHKIKWWRWRDEVRNIQINKQLTDRHVMLEIILQIEVCEWDVVEKAKILVVIAVLQRERERV